MGSTMSDTNRIRTSPHVEFTAVDGEVVLLDRRSGVYFGLNEIGSLIWQGLVKNLSVDEILTAIEKQYEVDRRTLLADLSRLLDTMQAKGLIQVS